MGFLLAMGAAACSHEPVDEIGLIKASIRNLEASIESRDLNAFFELIAEDFAGQQGELQRRQLRHLLMITLRRNPTIHAQILSIDVTITDEREPKRASSRVRVIAAGGRGVLPNEGHLYNIRSAWRKNGRSWQVINAEWE